MLLRTLTVFFFTCSISLIKANPTIIIRNDYNQSIIVYSNNHYIRTLKTGERLQLSDEPSMITIRAEGSPFYHKGIQDEIETMRLKARHNPYLHATIIIRRNTNNPLHFEYTTLDEQQIPQRPSTPPPGQSMHSTAQRTIYLNNDTLETISLKSIRTNGYAIPSLLVASYDGIVLYQTGEPGFTQITATGLQTNKTINLLPAVSQCLQDLQKYTHGVHEREIRIRKDAIVIQSLSD